MSPPFRRPLPPPLSLRRPSESFPILEWLSTVDAEPKPCPLRAPPSKNSPLPLGPILIHLPRTTIPTHGDFQIR